MKNNSAFFGYWISVFDEKSANDAVKMAGLPVLVMGANAAVLALISVFQTSADYYFAAFSAFIAILLIVIAFRIRAGHAAWIPLALVLFTVFLIVNAGLNLIFLYVLGQRPVEGTAIVFSWIVPLFCLALSISGFRGWRWLKANAGSVSY